MVPITPQSLQKLFYFHYKKGILGFLIVVQVSHKRPECLLSLRSPLSAPQVYYPLVYAVNGSGDAVNEAKNRGKIYIISGITHTLTHRGSPANTQQKNKVLTTHRAVVLSSFGRAPHRDMNFCSRRSATAPSCHAGEGGSTIPVALRVSPLNFQMGLDFLLGCF